MRLLVLGASNEIMPKGYIYSLGITDIINASTGGCSISAGVFNYLKYGRPLADFAIMSFELNEHGILRRGLRSEREVREMWSWTIRSVQSSNTKPIVVVLPRLAKETVQRASTCDIHKQISQDHGAVFVDIAEIFVRAQKSGVHYSKLMRDNAHMQHDAAQIVGHFLGEFLRSLSGNYVSGSMQKFSSCDFEMIGCAEFSPQRSVIKRKTSLSEASLIQLQQGEKFVVHGSPGDRLVALAANRCSMPGASLIFGSRAKGFYFDQAKVDGYMGVVADISDGIAFEQNQVEFEVAQTDAVQTEPTWLANMAPELVGKPALIEIEGFLVKKATDAIFEFESSLPPEDSLDFGKSGYGVALSKALHNL